MAMKLPHRDISPLWLLAGWFVLNIIQAAGSPLEADETYYWMYASQLDWGYFDHPPAVALLVALGKNWLPGALGLRFGHVLASTATVAALWHLLDSPRGKLLWLAAGLVLAQPMLNIYGFIATPDGPLLLFSVLYLMAYRNFLSRASFSNGIIWGITMAGLLYSKYHGLMLIVLSVLPQIGWLIRRPGAWMAALGGALLFSPHLYWQYVHDFPSFRYHLSGRNDVYQIAHTLGFIFNQLVVFSPFLLYHYVMTFVRDRARGSFAGALRWLTISFMLFFLLTTAKGHTEAHWTALVCIPLIWLVFRAARDRFPQWRQPLWTLSLLGIGVMMLARILLLTPSAWLPFKKPFDHRDWTEELAKIAGESPVVVQNSYRLASLYTFYTGKPAWTTTDILYRPNQYDLWRGDTAFHNQSVLLLGQKTWNFPPARPFQMHSSEGLLARIDSFQMTQGLSLEWRLRLPDTLQPTREYPLKVAVARPAAPQNTIRLDRGLPLDLFLIIRYSGKRMSFWKLRPMLNHQLPPAGEVLLYDGLIKVSADIPAGEARVELGLGYQGMPPLSGQSESRSVQIWVGE